ncbi:NADH dehydrogenase ubiquinone Fe-S protein 4 [Caldovatus aquaticus]|uniref:ETC complex I subunit n=1 Tax=Caldovatus aquaticus TaxID=2865671 RepID=A0ABS7F445_9PROT|nr:NADH dehydrogenase ubiquinone Fe-S protein 4 [Caldovatus aquaticus]MBW8270259.1 ETC complex I subunit [Caldovatus aquaticus]
MDGASSSTPSGRARLYQPPRSAMQSGRARSREWVLEFPPAERKRIDPLTGWFGSADTPATELRLRFESLEQALAYARANGIAVEIEPPPPRTTIRPRSYADNFRWNRTENWTH